MGKKLIQFVVSSLIAINGIFAPTLIMAEENVPPEETSETIADEAALVEETNAEEGTEEPSATPAEEVPVTTEDPVVIEEEPAIEEATPTPEIIDEQGNQTVVEEKAETETEVTLENVEPTPAPVTEEVEEPKEEAVQVENEELVKNTSETTMEEELEIVEVEEEEEENELYDAGKNPKELLLGMFFVGGGDYNAYDTDQSDRLFVSFNGKDFFLLNYAFEDIDKNSAIENRVRPAWDEGSQYVWALHDPGLTYGNGMYWTMSAYTPAPGQFFPMLAASKDLVNWSYPNSGITKSTTIKGTLPYGKDGQRNNSSWNTVAPDIMFIGSDAYIVVSLGYFGSFNGDSSINDRMSPYLLKVTNLRPGSTNPTTKQKKDMQPIVNYSNLIPINLPDICSDRIDGSLYQEGGKTYLAIKRNGIINEIWRSKGDITKNINVVSNKNNWELVRDTVSEGTEGPSLVKFQGRYYMYTDRLADFPSGSLRNRGIDVSSSSSLAKGWSYATACTFKDSKGNDLGQQRHGSVLTITNATEIEKIMKLYYKAGYKSVPSTTPFKGTVEPEKHSPSKAVRWVDTGLYNEKGRWYWYENGIRQGTYNDKKGVVGDGTIRGREIYDNGTDGWYWLDSNRDGAKAEGKEVWIPYIYQDEDKWTAAQKRSVAAESDVYTESGIRAQMSQQVLAAMNSKAGKWVRYDANGKMAKGWYTVEGAEASVYPTQIGNTYYYDYKTGLMAKGRVVIDGIEHYFDETTGVLVY